MKDLMVIAAMVFVFFFIVLPMIVRVIREYERLVLFRLGRCLGQRGPGLVFIVPIVDQVVKVNLREDMLDIPQQTCITKDNAPINIDFLIYYKVVDPVSTVVNVRNFVSAAQGVATTTLRAVVGDISLDDVLSKREQINEVLRTKLDEVTGRWGVKVTTVEIREIQPPREVQEAMTRQMSAERNRRAVVTEALGTREAAVTVAEGEKSAAILKAEGDRQATILRAEARRQQSILEAEGFSLALEKVFSVAKGVDPKTLSLQYFETLKALGAGPATKFIFPMEFTGMLKPFLDLAGKSEAK